MKQTDARRVATSIAALLACATGRLQAEPATADGSSSAAWSGGIYLASDYVYRGVSQSQHEPVWQAAVEFGAEAGAYVGAFASRVDYTGPDVPDDGVNVEFSYGVGWRTALSSTLVLDASLQHVTYPGADAGDVYDYFEATAALAWGEHATARVTYAPDYFGYDGAVRDYGLDLAWDAEGRGIGLSVGYFDQRLLSGEGYAYLDALVWRQLGPFRAELGVSRTFGYNDALEEVNGVARLAHPRARFGLAWEF